MLTRSTSRTFCISVTRRKIAAIWEEPTFRAVSDDDISLQKIKVMRILDGKLSLTRIRLGTFLLCLEGDYIKVYQINKIDKNTSHCECILYDTYSVYALPGYTHYENVLEEMALWHEENISNSEEVV